ncbi:MAG: APC family permease [Chthoniobacterales bacterium]|nr:APC family permease [Chthoniobacterales bacterium]
MDESAKPAASNTLRPGHVGLMQLVGQCFSIGPLIDVGLLLGIVASLAGAIAPLAVLLAALGMLAFSLVVAFYASETGGAGAMGDYIARAWGRTAGAAALGIYVISLLFSGAAGFTIALGQLTSDLFLSGLGWDFPWWLGAVIVCVSAWLLNVRGAATATRAQLVIVGISAVPFVLTAAAVVIQAGEANTLAVFSWSNPQGGDLFGALLFCILLFGGFETAGALAEETTNPRRNIPLALVGTVGLAALLLVFCTYAGTIYYGPDQAAKSWGQMINGYAVMAGKTLGPWAAWWIRLAVIVDFAATCIGFTAAASRGIYALARGGLLPRGLSATSRGGAPRAAANAVFVCALLTVAAGLLVPAGQRYDTLFVTATAQALLLVIVYTALALGALRLMIRGGQRQPAWRWFVFPLAAVVPLLALYGTFSPFPGYPERFGLYGGALALFLTAAWIVAAGRSLEGAKAPA